MRLLIGLMIIFTFAQDQVKRLHIDNQKSPAQANATAQEKETRTSDESKFELPDEMKDLSKDGPFSILTNPKLQKIASILSDKKTVGMLNKFANKNKFKTIIISQVFLLLIMMMVRNMIIAKQAGFWAMFVGGSILSGMHIFLALIVLPRFVYGAEYFDFVKVLKTVFDAVS